MNSILQLTCSVCTISKTSDKLYSSIIYETGLRERLGVQCGRTRVLCRKRTRERALQVLFDFLRVCYQAYTCLRFFYKGARTAERLRRLPATLPASRDPRVEGISRSRMFALSFKKANANLEIPAAMSTS
jgi:hypothetical protein